MAKQSAEAVALQATTTSKFIEAQDMLCEATYVAEFLRGVVCNAGGSEGGFELSSAQACGFICVFESLIERIEKAGALLDEHAAEQQKAGGS